MQIRLGGTKPTPRHREREKGWSFIRQRERGECKVEWETPPTSIFGQKPTTIAPQLGFFSGQTRVFVLDLKNAKNLVAWLPLSAVFYV